MFEPSVHLKPKNDLNLLLEKSILMSLHLIHFEQYNANNNNNTFYYFQLFSSSCSLTLWRETVSGVRTRSNVYKLQPGPVRMVDLRAPQANSLGFCRWFGLKMCPPFIPSTSHDIIKVTYLDFLLSSYRFPLSRKSSQSIHTRTYVYIQWDSGQRETGREKENVWKSAEAIPCR